MAGEYSETRTLLARSCDLTSRWKPSDIFLTMQELAMAHADLLNWGYSTLRARSLAFVLTRTELHMTRYPKIGEKVVCRTWIAPPAKWLFPRYYLFETEDGASLGMAASLWVLMDLNTRRMVSPQLLEMPAETAALPAPMDMPGRALPVTSVTDLRTHPAAYEEIDINGHVNNTRYVAWICDVLGVERLSEHPLSSLSINYAHEILPGQETVLRTQIEDNAFRMSGEVNGTLCFSLSGTLQ